MNTKINHYFEEIRSSATPCKYLQSEFFRGTSLDQIRQLPWQRIQAIEKFMENILGLAPYKTITAKIKAEVYSVHKVTDFSSTEYLKYSFSLFLAEAIRKNAIISALARAENLLELMKKSTDLLGLLEQLIIAEESPKQTILTNQGSATKLCWPTEIKLLRAMANDRAEVFASGIVHKFSPEDGFNAFCNLGKSSKNIPFNYWRRQKHLDKKTYLANPASVNWKAERRSYFSPIDILLIILTLEMKYKNVKLGQFG